MEVQYWFRQLWTQLVQTDIIQWLAFLFGVLEVLLAKANKIWLYPAGIIGILLSLWILYHGGLYAECILNVYYLVMSIYGWWHWVKRKGEPPVEISRCNRKEWVIVVMIVALSFVLLSFALSRFTDSTVPLWDAWVSATAWAGMWLLARRKLENWILLNISNAFAIPLLFQKQLLVYALLTIFLFVVAVQGYFKWRKILAAKRKSLYANPS